MKKLTLAVAVTGALGVTAANAAVLSEGGNGAVVPLAVHNGSPGDSTAVGLNSCANGVVYWTFWDPNTKHVVDDSFPITKFETQAFIWSEESGLGLQGFVGYLTFILDTSTSDPEVLDGVFGALDVSDIPCLAANAFQVNISNQDVVFQPTLPLDATLGDFGEAIGGVYLDLPISAKTDVVGLSAGANGHDLIFMRYFIDNATSTVYVWSTQDLSGTHGTSSDVFMVSHNQKDRSVTLEFPNEELNWFDPSVIPGRPQNDDDFLDGIITFTVPEARGDQDDDDEADQVRGVFSWTFVDGPAFGAVQTIINPIFMRDHHGNYGHRLRVITRIDQPSAVEYFDYECDASGDHSAEVLPWCQQP